MISPFLPPDLPAVTLAGIPERFGRADVPEGGYWEWLRVRLASGGEIAVFDPDHLCPLTAFGRDCRLAIELFQPEVAPNHTQAAGIAVTSERVSADSPPDIHGQVIAHHQTAWSYTGPVTSEEVVEGVVRRVVRHVIAAPQVTLRLVVDTGAGTLLAQLRDAAAPPPPGTWVTLRGGRPELVAIEASSLAEPEQPSR